MAGVHGISIVEYEETAEPELRSVLLPSVSSSVLAVNAEMPPAPELCRDRAIGMGERKAGEPTAEVKLFPVSFGRWLRRPQLKDMKISCQGKRIEVLP